MKIKINLEIPDRMIQGIQGNLREFQIKGIKALLESIGESLEEIDRVWIEDENGLKGFGGYPADAIDGGNPDDSFGYDWKIR